jgi:hypothetical protein
MRNVVVIQVSNTSNKPLLNIFVANSFCSDLAIVRQIHKNGKNRDSVYNYVRDLPLCNKIYIIKIYQIYTVSLSLSLSLYIYIYGV